MLSPFLLPPPHLQSDPVFIPGDLSLYRNFEEGSSNVSAEFGGRKKKKESCNCALAVRVIVNRIVVSFFLM